MPYEINATFGAKELISQWGQNPILLSGDLNDGIRDQRVLEIDRDER